MKSIILFTLSIVFAGTAKAGDVQYDIRVDGITCPFCVATSEKALKKISGVHAVGSDLESGTIFVCAASSVALGEEQLKQLFLDKGFTYRSFTRAEGCQMAEHTHADADLDSVSESHEDHIRG